MKHVSKSLLAIVALVGIGGALAFTPHRKAGTQLVYLKKQAGSPIYVYSNSTFFVAGSEICKGNSVTGDCTFTSTATAAFFNSQSVYQNAPPPISAVSPIVAYPTTSATAYQPR